MLRLIGRFLFFLLGCAVLLDALLPTFKENVQVKGHETHISVSNDTTRQGTRTTRSDTNYELFFTAPHLHACSVDSWVYNSLKDSDMLSVEATRVFKSCIKIERNDQLVYQGFAYRKILSVLGGLFLLLVAMVWTEDDMIMSIWFP